ncbi:MAG: BatA domain-containing protein [Planctomycetota bacterium]|nr:BatA domain-containing protein [Planctomycetota bacterium]
MTLGWGLPVMLWGALAVSIPILIHFLNRRRYVVRSFAAMAFLRQAYAQRRKRLRMENLLLLLLRCLVVLLAALAMALPFVPQDSLFSIVTGGRTDLVLVVDRSGSMGRLIGPDTTLDDRVLERVRNQISQLEAERGDTVTLVTPGGGDLLPGPIGASPSAALEILDSGLPAPTGTADMVAALRLIKERVRTVYRGRLEIEVYSDLQEASWREKLGGLFAEILEDGGGSVRVLDVVGDAAPVTNVGVEALSAENALLIKGDVVSFVGVLRNHGDVAVRGLTATFRLELPAPSKPIVRKVTDIEIPPRGTVDLPLRLRMDKAGPQHLELTLEGDQLPFDDQRSLAFEVRDGIDVLLVDGQAGANPLDGATAFLDMALDPTADGDDLGIVRFSTHVLDVRSFEEAGRDLYRYEAIVLANVDLVSEQTASLLEDVVRSGTPLLIFTGDRVDPDMATERLGRLLPMRIGAVRGDPKGTGEQDYVTLVLDDPPAPQLELFADPRLAVLLQVPVLAWNELTPWESVPVEPSATSNEVEEQRSIDGDTEAEVLAWFADSLGQVTPAIVQASRGLGRVVLFATSADDSWSLLPRQPATWLPLVHELMSALTAQDSALTNLPVGQSPTLIVDGKPESARLLSPSGAIENIGRPEVSSHGRRSLLSLDSTPLREAGAWSLEIEFADPTQPQRSLALAALPDAMEGDLRRLDGASLDQVLQGVDYSLGEQVDEGEDSEGAGGGDGSLFRALLWSLLAFAVGEVLLSRFMGGSR